MKYIYTLFLICFVVGGLIAQNLHPEYRPYNGIVAGVHNFGAVAHFTTNQIADDFGPRQLNSGNGYDEYQWHGGIDYNGLGGGNNDLGDLILAIEGGTVSEHSPSRAGTKYIAIQAPNQRNYRYIHIFQAANLGANNPILTTEGTTLKYMDGINAGDWAIIFRINGAYSAISSVVGMVTFMDEMGNQQTIATSNMVNVGNPVAPLGTSSNFSAHCHTEILTQLLNNGNPIPPGNDEFAKNSLEFTTHGPPVGGCTKNSTHTYWGCKKQ